MMGRNQSLLKAKLFTPNYLIFTSHFNIFNKNKSPDDIKAHPSEGKVGRNRHISEVNKKFNRLLQWEVIPLLFLSISLILYFNFKT